MPAIPRLRAAAIADGPVQTVNTCELHSVITIGRNLSNWIRGRIAEYGFVNGTGFVAMENLRSPDLASAKARAQRLTDYYLTLDMAKELALTATMSDDGLSADGVARRDRARALVARATGA